MTRLFSPEQPADSFEAIERDLAEGLKRQGMPADEADAYAKLSTERRRAKGPEQPAGAKREDGGPAFPIPSDRDQVTGCGIMEGWRGMSLRDWFAGQAVTGAELNAESVGWSPESVATRAYRIADAMLAERAKEKP